MAKEHLGRYSNSMDCLKQVLQQEGPSALFIGLVPTLYRNCIWNCIYYGTMHRIDQELPQLDSHVAGALRQLAIGTGVGMTATCANAPFDVVKSR
jgi:solute carrier family 25 2-oxodicarboxylate transporter 21